MPLDPHSALIIVDVQNGFTPGGKLAVAQADEIIPCINTLSQLFEQVVITQDWHPANHISFAENHAGKQPFDCIELTYGAQVLWPVHCVQGTHDAKLHAQLNTDKAQLIIRKGYHADIDSYSAFMEADRKTSTGLAGYLKEKGIHTVYITGIATDFCVAWTAMDAKTAGFKSVVIVDACKAIDLNGSLEQAWQQMTSCGVQAMQSEQLIQQIKA